MEKVKQTTLVLGEGITEFFFLDSLKDEYRALRQVKPSCPRNSSLEDLGTGGQVPVSQKN